MMKRKKISFLLTLAMLAVTYAWQKGIGFQNYSASAEEDLNTVKSTTKPAEPIEMISQGGPTLPTVKPTEKPAESSPEEEIQPTVKPTETSEGGTQPTIKPTENSDDGTQPAVKPAIQPTVISAGGIQPTVKPTVQPIRETIKPTIVPSVLVTSENPEAAPVSEETAVPAREEGRAFPDTLRAIKRRQVRNSAVCVNTAKPEDPAFKYRVCRRGTRAFPTILKGWE